MAKLLPVFTALAVVAFAVVAGPAMAVDVTINFGALNPSPGGCSHSAAADTGFVCANGQNFTANASTFTAAGFSNAFITPAALTFKPLVGNPLIGPPFNVLGESGLGENASGPPSACTDAFSPQNCEIAGAASVAVVSNHLITDAIIGSLQSGENFRFFTGSSIATLAPFGGLQTAGSCTPGPAAETCVVTGFSALAVGVQSGGTGDVLLVAVSQPPAAVPEPATLVLLGIALIGLGLVRRRRG